MHVYKALIHKSSLAEVSYIKRVFFFSFIDKHLLPLSTRKNDAD